MPEAALFRGSRFLLQLRRRTMFSREDAGQTTGGSSLHRADADFALTGFVHAAALLFYGPHSLDGRVASRLLFARSVPFASSPPRAPCDSLTSPLSSPLRAAVASSSVRSSGESRSERCMTRIPKRKKSHNLTLSLPQSRAFAPVTWPRFPGHDGPRADEARRARDIASRPHARRTPPTAPPHPPRTPWPPSPPSPPPRPPR